MVCTMLKNGNALLGGMALALAMVAAGPALAAGSSPYKVTYIQGVTGNPFYITVACGAQAEARKLNVAFSTTGPQQYDPAMQTQVLDAAIASRPDAIMISVDDPVALIPSLTQAKAAGIKIVMIDGDPKEKSLAVTNIQSNNAKGGAIAADQLAKLIGEKGTVMALTHFPSGGVTGQRLDGFAQEIKKYPKIKYLGVQYSHNQTAKAASIVSSTAAAHPDLNGIFTVTTNNTEGAATGIREAGRTGKIKLMGFDTSDPIVKDIGQGIVDADVVQYPYKLGQLGLQAAVDALDGKTVEREMATPFVVATPGNINSAEVEKYLYRSSCPSK